MTNELTMAIADVLNMIQHGVDTGSQVVAEQLPELYSQFFWWHLARHLVHLLIAIVTLLLGWVLFGVVKSCAEAEAKGKAVIKETRSKGQVTTIEQDCAPEEERRKAQLATGIGVAASIIGGILFTANILGILKLLIAPKLYLIDYLKTLM